MVKGVVFDFNGTLVNDLVQQQEAWDESDSRMRVSETGLSPKENEGFCTADRIRQLMPEAGSAMINLLARQKEEIYRELVRRDGLQLRKGAEELFAFLEEKNIPFTVATASIEENVRFFLEYFGLDRWLSLEEIVLDDGSYHSKGEMFAKASRKLGVDMQDLVIIEDSNGSIRSAREHGAGRIVQLLSHGSPSEDADIVVKGLNDPRIMEILEA